MQKGKLRIGLEIHGYLDTKEKLFCRCKSVKEATKKGIAENTFICPICTGQPGAKPMNHNEEAIKKIAQIGLMLNCKINTEQGFLFQRKHYSWPDLPKGYQDTVSGSYAMPVAFDGEFLGVRIREAHLEEDPAAWDPQTGEVDYNRSGMPLVEIVTEPDFFSSEQVIDWLKNLILVLSYIKAIDKKAGIKADVNVDTGGERVEIKNVNSIANIKRAIEYEEKRQLKEGAERETRRFDDLSGKTIRMRGKEEAADYRFLPDPDLAVVNVNDEYVDEIKAKLPETPQKKLENLIKKHKIDKKNAEVLAKNLEIVEFFEKVCESTEASFALPWVTIELLRVLNWNKKTLDETNIRVEHFVELLKMIKEGKITELKAKRILNEFVPESYSVSKKMKGIEKITDTKKVEEICRKVIDLNKSVAADYKKGNKNAFNFLMGEVMKLSESRADSKIAREVLISMLK